MKFLLKVVLPLLILISYGFLVTRYDPGIETFWSFLFTLVIFLVGVSIATYIVDLINPHFFGFDFRFWHPKSYSRFIQFDKQKGWNVPGGKGLRTIYSLFPIIFFLVVFIIAARLFSGEVDHELKRFGIITRAEVARYRYVSRGSIHYIYIRFKTNEGIEQEKQINAGRKYAAGDSVTVKYSSRRPSICKLISDDPETKDKTGSR